MTNQEIFRQNFRVQCRRLGVSKDEVQGIAPETWTKLEVAAEIMGNQTSRRIAAGLAATWMLANTHAGVVKTANDRRCVTIMVADMIGHFYSKGEADTYHASLSKLIEAGYKPDSMLIVLVEAATALWVENKIKETLEPSIVNKILQQVRG